MKNFLLTFVAVLLAAGLALLAYDRIVLKPRLEEIGRAEAVSLEEARAEARRIADELDSEVDRSVSDARKALDEQAAEEARRREAQAVEAGKMHDTALAAEALAQASRFKAMVAEYYMSSGDWPHALADLAPGRPEDQASGPVAAITIEPKGVIAISMKADVAAGSMLRLTPRANRNGMIEWTCSTASYPAAERIPACR